MLHPAYSKVAGVVVIGRCKNKAPDSGSSGAFVTMDLPRLCLRYSDSTVQKMLNPNEEKTCDGQTSYVMPGDVRRDHERHTDPHHSVLAH